MKSFDEIHNQFTLKWEGGDKFTNNPKDPGGATKFGISLRFLKNLPLKEADINIDGIITWQDVMALDAKRQAEIFRKYFWDTIKGDHLPAPLNGVLYDAGVNLGVVRAIKILQHFAGVTVDGVLGPRTLNAVSVLDPISIAKAVQTTRRLYYHELAFSTEWADDFLAGWRNRTVALSVFMGLSELSL